MPQPSTAEFDLTVREIAIRDHETGEETPAWEVVNENLDRPCRGETPQDALEVFAACFTTDNERVKIDVETLTESADEANPWER